MANKKGRLTKAELYYIQENPDKLSIGDMSKELKRPVTTIGKAAREFLQNPASKAKKKVVSSVSIEPAEEVEEPTEAENPVQEQPDKPDNFLQNKFGHDKSGKRSYSIMTPAASETSDVLKPGNIGKKTDQSHIFKPVSNKKQR